jgi:hypothetical protein
MSAPSLRPLGVRVAIVCGVLSLALTQASHETPAQVVTQQPVTSGATYQPGTFYPPYYGGGGWGGGGWGGGWGGWGYGGWGGVGSTAAGSYLTGLGNAIRAQGQYNLDTSAAAINLEEAARRDIENRKLWTETFFEKRRINQAYRDAQRRPPPEPETWVRLAQQAAPSRLSPSELDPVTGRIHWPIGLTGPEFQADRDRLDQMFADRALAHGAIGASGTAAIQSAVNQMMDNLRSRIREFDTSQYSAARNFLTSLSHEARHPTGYGPTASR